MGVESAGDPLAFNGGVAFQPDASGGGVFQYYNNTGMTIISLTFTAAITPNLTPSELPTFSCNTASDPTVPNPYFLFCSTQYFANNGDLEFTFSGTNPGTGGLDEGIPPVLSTCVYDNMNTPPSPSCTTGTFAISLNFNYSLTVDGGGWDSGGLTDPVFTATDVITAAPEPASVLFVGLALIAGVFVAGLRSLSGQTPKAAKMAGETAP